MSFVDSAVSPRKGEELDPKVIAKFLRNHVEGIQGEAVIEQFPSGYSNLSYLVRMGDKEMVLRRPPVGAKKIKAGHDMKREFTILSKLYPVYPLVPKPLVYCEDESIIGAQFYVMERIKGIILRKEPPQGLKISPSTARKMCEKLVDNLVTIHGIDYKSIGLDEIGKPEGFVKRQVDGWFERYQNAKTDDIPEVEEIIKWCNANIPQSQAPTLIHNDYKYDNIIFAPDDLTKIIGVLDWEMSTIGDPLFDVGVALSYWVNRDDPEEMHLARTVPTHLEGSYTRKEFVERYAEQSGREVRNIVFYYAFALFKLGVIAQQIYFRFTKGFTKDERFALLLAGVKVLMRRSLEAIEKDSI